MESADTAATGSSWAKRIALATSMAIVATNVWIGGPIVALWIGSRLQNASGGSLTIRPSTALAVFASLAVITVGLVKLLSVIAAAYDRASGTVPVKRRRDSWVSVERKSFPGVRPSLSAMERILVMVVAMAVIAFEIWFMFFSTSPIDQRSGRSSVPLAKPGALTLPHLGRAPGEPAAERA